MSVDVVTLDFPHTLHLSGRKEDGRTTPAVHERQVLKKRRQNVESSFRYRSNIVQDEEVHTVV